MEATNTIRVSEICGTDLISRESAQELSASIDLSTCTVCNEFELDFSTVEFMSRSFADQFHKERLRLQEEHVCEIHVVNANMEVLEMLSAVAKTQQASERKSAHIPVSRFSDVKSLSEYLLAL